MRPINILLLLLLSAAVFYGQTKTVEPLASYPPFADSQQLVVVTARDWNSSIGTARLFNREDTRSKWKPASDKFAVVLGKNGLALAKGVTAKDFTTVKAEGDGRSPAGLFPLTEAFGTGVKPVAVEMPYSKLGEYTECVDDPRSQFYNRIVDRMKVGVFGWKSSEKMLAVGEPYALGVFVGFNSFPVEKGSGSCIFLHVWKDQNTATEGCTAMERRNVERILGWIVRSKNPYLVQLTEADYKTKQKAWELPKL